MNKRQQSIVRIGAILVFLLNAFYAAGLNYISNSVQHPIGPDVASAYEPDNDSPQLVPIQRMVTSSFERTGRKVSVYISNGYCAGEGAARPTIILLLAFGALYFLAGWQSTRRPSEG